MAGEVSPTAVCSPRRKHAAPPAKRQTGRRGIISGLAAAVFCASCGILPIDVPARLDYLIKTTADGISVAVAVSGGPRPTVWVGFGSSPLGQDTARRIDTVAARSQTGAPLAIRQVGEVAYQVDVGGQDGWTLTYNVRVGAPPAAAYHRASSVSSEHLMLLGVDVLARFYDRPSAIDLVPEDRPLGEVEQATVRFDPASIPDGWRGVSAAPETALNTFRVLDHPALSAFAVGPYQVHDVDRTSGLRAAIHQNWTVGASRVLNYARQIATAQFREMGPPPGAAALMVFTPLPPRVRPRQGVRTAGMVWDRTLVLFAGTGPNAPQSNRTILEMLAVFLGHELFHLYVPWGLPISQPLSWLSEGWAEHMGRRSAVAARTLSASGSDGSLRDAYDRYREMGGARAGSLRNASESGDDLRDLLYVRGELVFRILSLEWQESGKPGSFDSILWQRLQSASDGEQPLDSAEVSAVFESMVNPSTVRRYVDGAAVITLPELGLGRR